MTAVPTPAGSGTRPDSDRELSQTRVFDAPRALVFAAFTDPAHVSNWWGPNGFRTTTYEHALEPGGVWRFTMHGPDGTDYENRVVYREVVPNERLVWDHSGDRDYARAFVTTVTFQEVDAGRTSVTLHLRAPSAAIMDEMKQFGAIEGAIDTLARLAEHLKTRAS